MSANPLTGLVSELRRRRVFRVAAVYAAAAFVVLQLADLVVEPLRLPDWTMALLIVLVLVGFVIAVVLSWIFQVGPDGIRRSPPAIATSGRSSRNAAYVGLGVLIGLVVVGSFGWFGERSRRSDLEAGEISAIAVLPFANLSADPEQEYFADGLAEELLDALSRIDGLRVPARTSSFAFKGQNLDVREIGRRLGVEAVLEGSVRKSGDRLRVSAQLIDVETGYQVFSETYDRRLDDVFAVQEELSRSILRAIDLGSGAGAADGAVVRSGTADPRAHDRYLLGLYHFHQRGPAIDTAIAHFAAALEADPEYAPAWAGLAAAYAVAPSHSLTIDGDSAVRGGKRAAQRALALDPRVAQAHAALGQLTANFDWDFDRAAEHYQAALALSPNTANTRMWLAEAHYIRGRAGDALAEMRLAAELDPLSPIVAQMTGVVLAGAGRYDEAMQWFERGRRLNPNLGTIHSAGAAVLLRMNRCAEAAEWAARMRRDRTLSGGFRIIFRVRCEPALRPEAAAVMRQLIDQMGTPGGPSSGVIAILYDAMGDLDNAEIWFERAHRARDSVLPIVLPTYFSDELLQRPRVATLVREMDMGWLLTR